MQGGGGWGDRIGGAGGVMSATGVARALNNIIRKNAWGGGCMGRLMMQQLAPLSPAAASAGKKTAV